MNTIVTSLGNNDVLLGRGSGPNEHEGNRIFRRMCADLAQRAIETQSTKPKRDFASILVDMVNASNGRFLRKLSKSEVVSVVIRNLHGIYPEGKQLPDLYVIAPKAVAVKKANQSFRHQYRLLLTRRPTSHLDEQEETANREIGGGDTDVARAMQAKPEVSSSKTPIFSQNNDTANRRTKELKRPHPNTRKEAASKRLKGPPSATSHGGGGGGESDAPTPFAISTSHRSEITERLRFSQDQVVNLALRNEFVTRAPVLNDLPRAPPGLTPLTNFMMPPALPPITGSTLPRLHQESASRALDGTRVNPFAWQGTLPSSNQLSTMPLLQSQTVEATQNVLDQASRLYNAPANLPSSADAALLHAFLLARHRFP